MRRPSEPVLTLLRQLLRAQRGRLVLGVLCSAGVAALGAIYAYLTGPLLESLLGAREQGGAPVLRALRLDQLDWTPGDPIRLMAVFLVGIAASKGVLQLAQTALLEGACQRMGHELRRTLYASLLVRPLREHRADTIGDLVARLVDDARLVQEALIQGPLTLLRELLAALCLLCVAVSLSPLLALIALTSLPVIALVVARLGRRVRGAATLAQLALGAMAGQAEQSLASLREVKAHRAEQRELERFGEHSWRMARWAERRAVRRALSPLVNEVLAASAVALSVWAAARVIASGDIAPAALVSFFAAILLMYRPVKAISGALQLLAASAPSAARIGELVERGRCTASGMDRERPDRPSEPWLGARAHPGALRRELRLEGVSFRYEHGPLVLDDVSCSLGVGEVVGLAGESGSGKSTLLDLICGLEPFDDGALVWDGRPLDADERLALPLHVGLVSQRPLVFDGSIAANVRYGCPDASDAEVWEALSAAGLAHDVRQMVQGLNTRLGQGGRGLSVGQAQRLALARALARGTRLLLLDEPASALDGQGVVQLVRTLRALRANCAVLVVSHREDLLEGVDRVLHLRGGRVQERGSSRSGRVRATWMRTGQLP